MNIRFHPLCNEYTGELFKLPVFVRMEFYVLYIPTDVLKDYDKYGDSVCMFEMIQECFEFDIEYLNRYPYDYEINCFVYGSYRRTQLNYTAEEVENIGEVNFPVIVGEFSNFFRYILQNVKCSQSIIKERKEREIKKNEEIERERIWHLECKQKREKEERIRWSVPKKNAPEVIKKLKGLKPFGLKLKIEVNGIYFLCRDSELVYIGQSINIHNRIVQHLKDDRKQFDSVYYMEIEKASLNLIERVLIGKLAPVFNIKHKAKLKVA